MMMWVVRPRVSFVAALCDNGIHECRSIANLCNSPSEKPLWFLDNQQWARDTGHKGPLCLVSRPGPVAKLPCPPSLEHVPGYWLDTTMRHKVTQRNYAMHLR